jgi:hypothetical protein
MSKRKQFTIEEKANLIFRLKNGEKNSDLANELGVGHSTISNIWKARDKIEQMFQNEKLSVKKLRNCTHMDLDTVLLRWFKNQRNLCIPINGPILQQKANELAEGLGKHNFNCSTGWIQRFRSRHNIVFSTISGESNSVNTEITQNWLEKVWPKIREGYTDDQIYNADETGLFFKMLPNRTFKFKGERCSGGKMSKERLTILVTASMTGKKMKLIVIGKSRNPRCFKNIKHIDCLPVTYESNSKAWMTAELWSKILLNWDLELGRKKEKILLLVDNCPAHSKVVLRNIKLVFLPSNCTSVLQPMDQGVIKCMKTYFRKSLVLKMINNMENKIDTNINVLDAILLIFKAWEKVTESTIQNCFHHAGFKNAIQQQLVQEEQEEICFPDIDDYVNFDNNLLTSEPLNDQELISSFSDAPEEDENNEEADTADEDFSINAVFNAVKKLSNYMALNNVSSTINFDKLEKKIENDFYTNKIQTKITDFFNSQ